MGSLLFLNEHGEMVDMGNRGGYGVDWINGEKGGCVQGVLFRKNK